MAYTLLRTRFLLPFYISSKKCLSKIDSTSFGKLKYTLVLLPVICASFFFLRFAFRIRLQLQQSDSNVYGMTLDFPTTKRNGVTAAALLNNSDLQILPILLKNHALIRMLTLCASAENEAQVDLCRGLSPDAINIVTQSISLQKHLKEEIKKKLNLLQYPKVSECFVVNYMEYMPYQHSGFGSLLHQILHGLSHAMKANRTFVLASSNVFLNSSWDTWFEPISSCQLFFWKWKFAMAMANSLLPILKNVTELSSKEDFLISVTNKIATSSVVYEIQNFSSTYISAQNFLQRTLALRDSVLDLRSEERSILEDMFKICVKILKDPQWSSHFIVPQISFEDSELLQMLTVSLNVEQFFALEEVKSEPRDNKDLMRLPFQNISSMLFPEPAVWYLGNILEFVYSLRSLQVRSFIEEQRKAIISGDFPRICIHIRRSDKITAKESKYYEFMQYIGKAIHFQEILREIHGLKTVPYIFIATDDPSIISEARKMKDMRFYMNEGSIKLARNTSLDSRLSTDAVNYLLFDLDILRECTYFVGTSSSNIGRLVYEHLTTQRLQPSAFFISLDYKWFGYI